MKHKIIQQFYTNKMEQPIVLAVASQICITVFVDWLKQE